jgi:hypothetical protein
VGVDANRPHDDYERVLDHLAGEHDVACERETTAI